MSEPIRPGRLNLIPNTAADFKAVWIATRDEQIDRAKIQQTQQWFFRHGRLSADKAAEMDVAAVRQGAIIDAVYVEVERVLGQQAADAMRREVREAVPGQDIGPVPPAPTIPPIQPSKPNGGDQLGLF